MGTTTEIRDGEASLRLQTRAANRVAAAFAGLLAAALIPLWLGLLGVQDAPPFDLGSRWLGHAVGVAVLTSFLVVNLWFVGRMFRLAFVHRPKVVVTDGGLTIHDSHLLKRPLTIPRHYIRAISTVSLDEPRWWEAGTFTLVREEKGITWDAGDDDTSAALDEITRFLLPYIGTDESIAPNVAVILERPLDVDAYRRWGWVDRDVRSPRRASDPKPGFLLAVRDAPAFQAAIAAWGVARKLTDADADVLEPTESDVRRYRRVAMQRAARWLFVLFLLLEKLRVLFFD